MKQPPEQISKAAAGGEKFLKNFANLKEKQQLCWSPFFTRLQVFSPAAEDFDMLSQCLIPYITKKVNSYSLVLGQQRLTALQIQNFH